VYKHTFPNGNIYIGITGQEPEKRWANGMGYQGQRVFKYIVEFGWNNITHEILYSNLTETEAMSIEKKLIEGNKSVSFNDKYVLPSKLRGRKPNYVYPPKQTFEINGVTKTIDEWCGDYKISRATVLHRIKKIWFFTVSGVELSANSAKGWLQSNPA
jgi:hypothetical protein